MRLSMTAQRSCNSINLMKRPEGSSRRRELRATTRSAFAGRNRPIPEPTAFDVNTSIQRCLVKATALHGLGLYIYAGEDLPQPLADVANDPPPPADDWPAPSRLRPDRTPVSRRPAPEYISKAQQTHIHRLAVEVGISLERVLSYFCINSLSDITTMNFDRVIRSLEKHRKAA